MMPTPNPIKTLVAIKTPTAPAGTSALSNAPLPATIAAAASRARVGNPRSRRLTTLAPTSAPSRSAEATMLIPAADKLNCDVSCRPAAAITPAA